MIFQFTSEQEQLRETVRSVLTERSTEAAVRRTMSSADGVDRELWRHLGSLGLLGITVPTGAGGAGGSFIDQAVVLEEMGRVLLCGPTLSTVRATTLLAELTADADCLDLLSSIQDGTTLVAVVEGDAPPAPAALDDEIHAEHGPDGWRLHGRVSHVSDAPIADVLLVVGGSARGPAVFCVDANASGLTSTATPTVDQTRRLGTLVFDGAPAKLLADGDAAVSALRVMPDRLLAAVAAEQLGTAAAAFEDAVSYARTRYQFGRPIGGFQAIKHRCAELLVDVELARSAVYSAAWAAAESSAELRAAALIAKTWTTDTCVRVARENIQIHGGMGFTWEHSAHLYYRRALSGAALFGDSRRQRGQFLDLISGPA